MTYQYLTCCVNSTAEKIIAMTESSRQITWRTFTKNVPIEETEKLFPFYQYRGERYNRFTGELTSPLHISRDYAVSFYKSHYDGAPCYYICHSGIEYIFTDQRKEQSVK